MRGKKAPRESSSRLVCLYHHRINKVVSPTVGYLPPNCRAEITSTSDLDNQYHAHNQSKKLLSYFTTMFGMKESIDTAVRHYKEGNLNWPMIIYISLAHAAAIIGLFSLSQCHKYTLLWAFVLWPIRLVKVNMKRKEHWKPNISNRCISSYISTCSGVGITGGVHRLWAHRSYKATYPLRLWLMLSNSIANQGSIWHWARDHRVHHKHSEVTTKEI